MKFQYLLACLYNSFSVKVIRISLLAWKPLVAEVQNYLTTKQSRQHRTIYKTLADQQFKSREDMGEWMKVCCHGVDVKGMLSGRLKQMHLSKNEINFTTESRICILRITVILNNLLNRRKQYSLVNALY